MTYEHIHHHDNHRPVLLDAVVDHLAPAPGERYLDLTAGYGGHASAIMAEMNPPEAVLVDRDQNAIRVLRDLHLKGATILKSDFRAACTQLLEDNQRFDMILLDLGVSSPQLDNAERGFSFQSDGPLDMRMDQDGTMPTASELINSLSEDELASVLKEYGQEPFSKRIAAAIKREGPITSTAALAAIVKRATPRTPSKGRSNTHPATRTFQAIRIAVNGELSQLRETLPMLPELLNEGGRLAIISFHSLEDRMVKQFLKEQSQYEYDSTLKLLTKRPISGATEDSFHSRSRSAKLRVAVKIKTK